MGGGSAFFGIRAGSIQATPVEVETQMGFVAKITVGRKREDERN
jgi:hypothetical protein